MKRPDSKSSDRRGRPTTPTITILFGGGAQALVEYLDCFPVETVLVFDAPAELAQRVAANHLEHVHIFPLAVGHTALTISANADEATRKCLRELPGTDLGQGLGQFRGIGALAAKELLADLNFQFFLSEVLPLQLLANHGTLTHVRIVGKAGLAGGTGSEGVLILVDAVREVLLKKTDAVVTVQLDLIGGITAAGLGRRVPKNAAAGIARAMAYVMADNHDPRESRIAICRELPAVGADRVARDNLVLQLEQSLTADEVREITDRRAPNEALNGRFGNLRTLRADFHHSLHPRLDVAADVARPFDANLRALSKVRSDRSVDNLEFQEHRRALHQEPIDDLVSRAFVSDPDELYESAREPAFEVHYQVWASLKSHTRVNLSAPHTVFSVPPRDTQETRDRLALQRASLNALNAELTDLNGLRQELEQDAASLDRKVAKAIDAIQPKSQLQRLFAAMRSEQGRMESLADAVRDYRENLNTLLEVQAKILSLEAACRELEEEHRFLLGKLKYLVARLEPLVVRGNADRTELLVRCAPLDEYFSELWQIDDRTTEDRLIRLLGLAVREVTLHGLAKIVRAASPRLDVIAKQIAKRSVAITGPSWGGKARREKPLSIHVLPPLDPNESAMLRQLILQDDPEALVAVADTASAGVNCVDLHQYTVEDATDLMTGFYRQEYAELADHPQRPLYLPTEVVWRDELIDEIITRNSKSTKAKGNQNGQDAA